MSLLFKAALLLLAAVIERSAACEMFELGDCSADCGVGYTSGEYMCTENGTQFVCGMVNMTCNTEPCDGGPGPWSECSASCGGGSKTRSVGNDTQTLPCNTQSCESPECPDAAADVVFVVDRSSSITNFGFEAAKQIVSDAVSGLPAGVRVSMVAFSTHANVVFELTDSPSSAAILAPRFTGGSGVLAYAVRAAGAALSSSEISVPKIVVFLTDGEQMVLEACAYDMATMLRDGGVQLLSVVIGSAAPSSLYPVTSPEFNKNQFLSTDVLAARKISAAIRGALADCEASDDDMSQLDDSGLKGGLMMSAGVASGRCGEWSEWSKCDKPCGQRGMHEKSMTCTDEKGEQIKKYIFLKCMIPCPVVRRIPRVDEAFCSLVDWNHGMVWIAHPGNCHLYFVCERVYRNKFRMHGIDCGELFWNQYTLLCEHQSPIPNVVKCKEVRNHPQRPPKIIPATNCKKDDMLLEFDFEGDFKDSCSGKKVKLVQAGVEDVELTTERGNTAACFNGNSFMEIPFLRKWFAHRQVTEFTVALWYKRCSLDTRHEEGLIHNGGCLSTNTGFQVTTGYGGVFAGVTTSDPFPPGLKQLFAVTAPNSNWLDRAGWQQAVMVFDGENVKLYVQGYERERAPSEGYLLNGWSDAFLGKLCEGKFFCGCIDNLRIWNRVLSPGEVLNLQRH
ncbi:hypothetical protein NP493_1332g00043 [Ridgeia piscesae]|uniref:VWFA domain-containing protein n=1 Tax=Ridgeia piscesae TaxID=27915 RepID=A0AAD9NDF7_RIDPI|nr:hypothetical protein NP493_1332g00043 [Ridgeia piscesae]